jgi:hypothetical protein
MRKLSASLKNDTISTLTLVFPSRAALRRLLQFAGDMFIRVGTYAAALLQAKHSSAPVYYYSADHAKDSPLGFVNLMNKLSADRLHMVFTNATRLNNLRLRPGNIWLTEMMMLIMYPSPLPCSPYSYTAVLQSGKGICKL